MNLYPVYLVHERLSGYPVETSGPFRIGDPNYRSKSLILDPSNNHIQFKAYTEGEAFCLEIEFELPGGRQGDLMLLFDPDHSYKKNHNAFAFRIDEAGRLRYQEYRYELETLDVPEGIVYSHNLTVGLHHVCLSIPLSMLRFQTSSRNVIGFNTVLTIQAGEDTEYTTWSGIKGNKIHNGQGTGILLFTKGLRPEEIQAWAEQVGAEENFYYTKWAKPKIPAEIFSYMGVKQQGFTVRMSKEDVRKARENAEHTEWGRRMKEEIIGIADYWAAMSDDELFEMVPVGNPRANTVGRDFGDPFTGGKGDAYQVCLEKPYQFYNPVSNKWWHNGMTIQNPATGENMILDDDGRGFLAPDGFPNPGVRYMYTASYRTFILSMMMGHPYCSILEDRAVCPETTGGRNSGAISNLAYAYLLTDDKKYARKASILIGRIAELVPYMNGNYGAGYYDTTLISEPTTTETHWLSNFFDATDLIYDVLEELEPELRNFFAGKPDAIGTIIKPALSLFWSHSNGKLLFNRCGTWS